MNKRLAWLEYALYLGGAAMIVAFLFVRWDGEQARKEGLDAFEQARAVQQDVLPEQLPGEPELSANPDERSEPVGEDASDGPIPAADTALAVLRVPRLGIDVPVFDGADDHNLDRGAARIRGTARPGEAGNLGIAAHRDTFFRPLKDIEIGDRLDLETVGGGETYLVTAIDIVEPEDVSVLAASGEKELTLVTCYPFYFVGQAPQRYIVKARAGHSTPLEQGEQNL